MLLYRCISIHVLVENPILGQNKSILDRHVFECNSMQYIYIERFTNDNLTQKPEKSNVGNFVTDNQQDGKTDEAGFIRTLWSAGRV